MAAVLVYDVPPLISFVLFVHKTALKQRDALKRDTLLFKIVLRKRDCLCTVKGLPCLLVKLFKKNANRENTKKKALNIKRD